MSTATDAPTAAGPEPTPAPASRPSWSLGHLPALDGLRGAAVAAVLLYHGGYLDGGYLGVDLFFVLSGFLITSLLLAEHRGSGRIHLPSFWGRRARRLLPALFGLLAGVAVYAAVWARPVDLHDIRVSAIAALLYVANWQQILAGASYWDISLQPSPLQHLWSLAIEEQFYVLWPVVIAWTIKRGGRNRGRRVQDLCTTLAIASAGWFVALHAFGASDTRVYQGTDTRATALLLGAALAGWRVHRGPVEDQPIAERVEQLGLASVGLLAVAWVFLDGTSPLLYWGGLPACSLLATVVVAAATSRSSRVVGPLFSNRALRWLGTISYGLYLWHWLVYLVLNEGRTGRSGLPLLGMRLLVSLALALASYHLLEQPIRRNGLPTTRSRALAATGAIAVVVAIVVSTSGAVDPLAVNQATAPTEAIGRIDGAPTVMVVGDSVGNSVAGPMIDDPWSFGVNPVNQAVIGCELMFRGNQARTSDGRVEERPDCTAGYRDAVARYAPNVVLVFFGGANSGEVVIDGEPTQACDPAFHDEQVALHRQAVDDLGSNGATVALVTLVPADDEAFFPPPWNDNIACYNRTLAEVADATGASLVDLGSWVCPDAGCRKDIDGAPARPDGLHFNGAGGRAVAAHLVTEGLDAAGLEPAASAAAVPESCAPLRQATSPVLGLLGRDSDDARRSALDRLDHVDLAAIAAAAPRELQPPMLVLAGSTDEVEQVLRSTGEGTVLEASTFSPRLAAALTELDAELERTCTGR